MCVPTCAHQESQKGKLRKFSSLYGEVRGHDLQQMGADHLNISSSLVNVWQGSASEEMINEWNCSFIVKIKRGIRCVTSLHQLFNAPLIVFQPSKRYTSTMGVFTTFLVQPIWFRGDPIACTKFHTLCYNILKGHNCYHWPCYIEFIAEWWLQDTKGKRTICNFLSD